MRYRGPGRIIIRYFPDKEIIRTGSRKLCRVSYAQYLMAPADALKLGRDLESRNTGYTGIDLVKDKGRRIVGFTQYVLDREHDTRCLSS